MEISGHDTLRHPFGFVDGQHNGTASLAQKIRNHAVLRRHTQATVDHENNQVGFGNGLLGLFGHLGHDAGFRDRFKAAGIYTNELTRGNAAIAVMAIAG